jgi:hypothetical protein
MRKLILILPVAAILLAGGVLFAGLGRSLANTDTPAAPAAETAVPPTDAVPADAAEGEWTETVRKAPKPPKSNHKKPHPPHAKGPRR